MFKIQTNHFHIALFASIVVAILLGATHVMLKVFGGVLLLTILIDVSTASTERTRSLLMCFAQDAYIAVLVSAFTINSKVQPVLFAVVLLVVITVALGVLVINGIGYLIEHDDTS